MAPFLNLWPCLLLLLLLLVAAVFSPRASSDLAAGEDVTVALPSAYIKDFVGRAALLGPRATQSCQFTAALSVEAVDGVYTCALVVLLGDLKVWASDHSARFVPHGKCILRLNVDGELQISDRYGRIGWNSGTSGQGVKRVHLDRRIGNIILFDSKNQTKWQSFSYPTNVMLWPQRLNATDRLTSFLSNSSPAFYSFEVQQDKIVAYLNWKDGKYSYWQFKPPKSLRIAFTRLSPRGLKIYDSNSKRIADISATGSEAVKFLALGSTGNVGLYHCSPWRDTFEVSYEALEFCDLPLPCGTYGICSSSNTCTYLEQSTTEYRTSRGIQLGFNKGFCGVDRSRLKMVELEGITTVLRTSTPRGNVSKDDCLGACFKDCSCAAALYLENSSICFQYELIGGARETDTEIGSSYWVKVLRDADVHPEATNSSLVTKVLIIGGVIDAIALCVILGALLYYFFKVRKRTTVDSGTNDG